MLRSEHHPSQAKNLSIQSTMAATTFHHFLLLPFELRAQIWETTVEPRTVEVRTVRRRIAVHVDLLPGNQEKNRRKNRKANPDNPTEAQQCVRRVFSPTPVPGPVQACREARNLGLYQRAFSEIAAASHDPEQRYVWLNLEIDMVSIGTTPFSTLNPVALLIKRLKFARKLSDYIRLENMSWGITDFVNVKEIQVLCLKGLREWHGASDVYLWPCGKENVLCIDATDGQMMGMVELDDMIDEEEEGEYEGQIPWQPYD